MTEFFYEQELTSKYLDLFLAPIRKCKDYKPKFGESQNEDGVSLEGFLELYGNDPFYSWIGLDSGLMYAAHKAAGGMTSIYRQIGIGCEHLFREIIIDTTQYNDRDFALWSYETKTQSGKTKTLTLDGRLELSEIQNVKVKNRVQNWITAYCKELSVTQIPQNGVVFEVRQGYKSKDSKRQNADIDNATVAYANGYLPVFAVFSSQIDSDIVLRYRNNRCGIITGTNSSNPQTSLFTFCKEILGYDLAAFFKNKEFHLKPKEAKYLLSQALQSYNEINKKYPQEVFIHSKTKFNSEEWNAFMEVTPKETNLVGVTITKTKPLKLYKREGDYPVLRGNALVINEKSAFLWTIGYVPKIQTVLSMEVPNPIFIEINKGEADIVQVLKDILALTKLNYNACIYADGIPVTLRFADKIGEILTASTEIKVPPLAFKYYI